MEDVSDVLPGEMGIERYVGNVNVERLDGTLLKDVPLYRKEKYADKDDTESIYEREYVAVKNDEEIYLGDDKGTNLTLKERTAWYEEN